MYRNMLQLKVFCGIVLAAVCLRLKSKNASYANTNYTNLEGTLFTRDHSYDNRMGPDGNNTVTRSLADCSMLCEDDECLGFFFNRISKECFTVTEKIPPSSLSVVQNVSFFRKRVTSENIEEKEFDKLFERDIQSDDKFAKDITGPNGIDLDDCSRLCREDPCLGFFYNTKYKNCIPVTKPFVPELGSFPTTLYYKRKVTQRSNTITLEYNICPPLVEGTLKINITSAERYEIFINPRKVKNDQASDICAQEGKSLLQMKSHLHYDYVTSLLQCKEFKDHEFWIGAKKIGQIWQFDYNRPLNMTYFCPNKPNNPEYEHCVRFQTFCLNDQDCAAKAGVLCD